MEEQKILEQQIYTPLTLKKMMSLVNKAKKDKKFKEETTFEWLEKMNEKYKFKGGYNFKKSVNGILQFLARGYFDTLGEIGVCYDGLDKSIILKSVKEIKIDKYKIEHNKGSNNVWFQNITKSVTFSIKNSDLIDDDFDSEVLLVIIWKKDDFRIINCVNEFECHSYVGADIRFFAKKMFRDIVKENIDDQEYIEKIIGWDGKLRSSEQSVMPYIWKMNEYNENRKNYFTSILFCDKVNHKWEFKNFYSDKNENYILDAYNFYINMKENEIKCYFWEIFKQDKQERRGY